MAPEQLMAKGGTKSQLCHGNFAGDASASLSMSHISGFQCPTNSYVYWIFQSGASSWLEKIRPT